jgi:hypothetical protein
VDKTKNKKGTFLKTQNTFSSHTERRARAATVINYGEVLL